MATWANRFAILAEPSGVGSGASTGQVDGTPGTNGASFHVFVAPVVVPAALPAAVPAEFPIAESPYAVEATGRGFGAAPDKARPAPASNRRLQASPSWISSSQRSPNSPTAAAALRSFLIRIHVGLHLQIIQHVKVCVEILVLVERLQITNCGSGSSNLRNLDVARA